MFGSHFNLLLINIIVNKKGINDMCNILCFIQYFQFILLYIYYWLINETLSLNEGNIFKLNL